MFFKLKRVPSLKLPTIPSLSLERILLFPLFMMIVLAMFLPSDGNYGIFTPKSLCYIFAMLSMPLLLAYRSWIKTGTSKLTVPLALGLLMVFVSLAISLARDLTVPGMAFSQAKIFIVTLTSFTCITVVLREKLLSHKTFVKTLLLCNMIYCVLKVIGIIGCLLGVFDPFALFKRLGVNVMVTGISAGLSRLQTSLDVLTPYLWLFYFRRDNLKVTLPRWICWIYVPITAFSIFLSFSRFLWFVAAVSLFLSLLGRDLKRWLKTGLSILVLVIVGSVFIGPDKLSGAVVHRFFSDEVRSSDNHRSDQLEMMGDEIEKYPFIGKGIGSNAGDRPHFSYEVQWVSFLMQFGFFGVSLIAVGMGTLALQYLRFSLDWPRLAFLSGFLLFVLGGFTNPFLLSLNSGIMYAAYLFPLAIKLEK